MRWVKETFPPLARFMWLLITMRLSIISLAGMVRTLVAVGTVRLASMLVARLFAIPRSVWTTFSGSAGDSVSAAFSGAFAAGLGASAGIGWGFASMDVVRATVGFAVLGVTAAGAGVPSVISAGIWGCWAGSASASRTFSADGCAPAGTSSTWR